MKRLLVLAAVLALAVPASAARLPIGASRDWWPVWSPSARDIAFTRINAAGRVFALEVLDLQTRRVTQVGSSSGQLSPTWSSDGAELAYSSGGVLYVVRPDGGGKQRYGAPAKAFAPAWRPATTQLAYLTTSGAKNTDLWVAQALWARSAIGTPAWAPDGGAVAFQRDDGIYIATGPGAERRVATAVNPGPPAWSPDGMQIAFAADGSVFVVPVAGTTGPRRLAGPFADVGPLSWSKQSDSLAYTVRGGVELSMLSKGTSQLVRGAGVGAAFSPRGNLLAFSGLHPGCPGHTTIRIYADKARRPALTGGCAIQGTSANDAIEGTSEGGDVVLAGAGNDRIHARNGHRDRVNCGPGRDVVWADRADRLTGCEVVHL